MARLNVITPNTNVSPTLAKFPTGASNGDILVWNSTTSKIEWATSPHITKYTDAEAVDAIEAVSALTFTSNNVDFNFVKSITRGTDGYTYWNHDEFWIGDSVGLVIENNAISPWGNTVKTAGVFVADRLYTIVTAGTTDYTLIGAADNNVDTKFIATGVGTGTGTAREHTPIVLGSSSAGSGVLIDNRLVVSKTTDANSTATFDVPTTFNDPVYIYNSTQIDGYLTFNGSSAQTGKQEFNNINADLCAEFNNPIQVDGTAVFNNNVEIVVSNGQNSPVKMEKASGLNLTSPVLHLEGGESGWNKPQMLLEDSNGKACSIVGRHDTGQDNYQLNYTVDPDNEHPRTGVGGNGNTLAGDYFFGFVKNYSDQSAISMVMDVYGANGGFNINAYDDSNGTNWSGDGRAYNPKPIRLKGSQSELWAGGSTQILVADTTRVTINKLTRLHNAASDPGSPLEGDVYYNTGTDRIKLYTGAGWKTLSVD